MNELRECETHLKEYLNEKFTLNVSCSFMLDIGIDTDVWTKDQTNRIFFEVNDKELTICEIRLYKTPDRVHHWCGSADVVPHSRRQFVRKNRRYAGLSHYRYFCNYGFVLVGNQDVRCGAENYWFVFSNNLIFIKSYHAHLIKAR